MKQRVRVKYINYLKEYKMKIVNPYALYDADARAAMLATGIPNDGTVYFSGTPQQITGAEYWSLAHWFITELKYSGWWDKIKLLYLNFGDTLNTQKINFKSPSLYAIQKAVGSVDADFVFDRFGSKSIKSTSYIETVATPTSINMAKYSFIASYSQTNGALGGVFYYDFGSSATNYSSLLLAFNRPDLSGAAANMWEDSTIALTSLSTSQGSGMFIGCRQSDTSNKLYINGVNTATNTNKTGFTRPTITFRWHNRVPNRSISFSCVGDALTHQECVDFSYLVNSLQSKLGRAVY